LYFRAYNRDVCQSPAHGRLDVLRPPRLEAVPERSWDLAGRKPRSRDHLNRAPRQPQPGHQGSRFDWLAGGFYGDEKGRDDSKLFLAGFDIQSGGHDITSRT
jgi:hypothetical protein